MDLHNDARHEHLSFVPKNSKDLLYRVWFYKKEHMALFEGFASFLKNIEFICKYSNIAIWQFVRKFCVLVVILINKFCSSLDMCYLQYYYKYFK